MVRRLKADPTTRTLRVVMLTSLQKPEHRRKVEQAGVDAYIVIPVDSAELETMLQELMQRPPRTL
jgi:CheY-like chemotaxis protein